MTDSPGYVKALALLRTLSGASGIHASAESTANYRAVFVRDAVMAGIAGLLADDAIIVAAFVRTLDHVRDLQGPEGQIASNFEHRAGHAPVVSFGTLVPRLDAASWYLIGIALGARAGVLSPATFRHSVHRVVLLLNAIEYNGRHLLYVPAGGDWADEYVYEGYILHDQVLRAWALRLVAETFDEPQWHDKSSLIEQAIATTFWPAGRPEGRYPLAAVSPVRVHDAFDLATCSLLALGTSLREAGASALDYVADSFLSRDELPPAFHPVIEPGDADWPALQRYQLHGFRNRPHEYHNGGVWMIWLGWLALALADGARASELATLRSLVETRLSAMPHFQFEEYFHGRSGQPAGTRGMAYSATGLVMLMAAGTADQHRVFAR